MKTVVRNLICFWYITVCFPSCWLKEEIIKDDAMINWHDTNFVLSGQGVWISGGGKDYSTCGDGKDADIWFISKHVDLSDIFADVVNVDVEVGEFALCFDPKISKEMPCYSNYFQLYVYRGENQPDFPDINTNKPSLRTFLQSDFSPVYNITNNTTTLNKRENQTFSFPAQNKSKGITFGIRSRGACGKIYRMKMYYYYCEEICFNGIKISNTSSPANQSKQVTGSCPNNSSPSNNETNLNGSCSSNGTWFIPDIINCSCIQGYSTSDDCQCSPVTTFASQSISTTPKNPGTIATTTTNDPDNDKSEESKGFPLLYIIIIAVGSGVLLILLAFFVFRSRRRMKGKSRPPAPGIVNEGVELPNVGQRTYVDPLIYDRPEDAITKFTNELDKSVLFLEMMIGGGEFGDVYKGKMTKPDGSKITVAVKTLKHDASMKSEKDFLFEASVMGQFDNPNVIHLEGVVTKSKPFMIVTEFMGNGSLENFLKINDGKLTVLQLIGMSRDVASGMKYLAEINFVHRDLAARNILIDTSLLCKVADFGLSRELESTDSSRGEYATSGGMIPVRWTAPESISFRKFSSASDVWSYGILLWEIMSFAERPYGDWDNFVLIQQLDKGYRLPSPKNCPLAVHKLMLQCWQKKRSDRPSFADITSLTDKWILSPETMEDDADPSPTLEEWLESIKMQNYIPMFAAAGYQYPSELVALKDEDLRRIGVSLVGHRNKVLKNARFLPPVAGPSRLEKTASLQV